MRKAVLISVNKPHTENIHTGAKTSELRTSPPKLPTPFKVYMYETKENGGCGKVVSEWICKSMTEWLMYMGIPAHLSSVACVSNEHIRKYCADGKKNITEMLIDQSSVRVYDKPKELKEFYKRCYSGCDNCIYDSWDYDLGGGKDRICTVSNKKPIKRPPQSWCYVEEIGT